MKTELPFIVIGAKDQGSHAHLVELLKREIGVSIVYIDTYPEQEEVEGGITLFVSREEIE